MVRLEAGRLRRSLDSYYVDAGKHDPLRITIRKGAYVPHFEWQTRDAAGTASGALAVAAPAPQIASDTGSSTPRGLGSLGRVAAVVVAGLLAAGLGWYWLHGREETRAPGGPSVIVLPFQATGASEETGLFASGDAFVWFDGTHAVTPLPTQVNAGEDETYPFGP